MCGWWIWPKPWAYKWKKRLFLPTFSIIAFPRKEPTFLISAQIFPSKLLEPAEQSMVSPSSSEEKMLSQVLFRRTIHVAEVPNSCKILLYWLLRSKIWYFRVIWLFIAKFFYKNGIFLCFLEGRGKKSKQNDTAWFSPNSLVFSSFRYCEMFVIVPCAGALYYIYIPKLHIYEKNFLSFNQIF